MPPENIKNNFGLKIVLGVIIVIILIFAGLYVYLNFISFNYKIQKPFYTSTSTIAAVSSSTPTNNSDTPYSFFAVHFEIDPSCTIANPCKGESGSFAASDVWQNMVTTVELANQYHTPLTIMFWPGTAAYAVASPERLAEVRQWQAEGHEIGIHNQGCYNSAVNSSKEKAGLYARSDDAVYMQLLGEQKLKSGTNSCDSAVTPGYTYEGGGRPDGRSAMAIKQAGMAGHQVYGLNMKAGYIDGTAIKIAQYNTLNKNEIYGVVDHAEGDAGNLGGSKELKEWLTFLYSKDPIGTKRMTLTNIMEEYVLPNNLVVTMTNVCSSADTRVQQCLALNKTIPTKPGSVNCMDPYNTGAFNFGRCIQTGTYCALEDDLDQDMLCRLSRGDYYNYVPTSCEIRNIINQPYSITSFCPAGAVTDNVKIPAGVTKPSLGPKINNACGDGYCDGPAGEKTSCPADCRL